MLRGNRFYLRRHVPTDLQPIIGRAEVWRSLKTDSLQTALRRLSISAAALESEFERIRLDAGLTVDQTILRPSQDDLGGSVLPARLEAQGSAAPQPLSLEQAYARYMDDPTHRWSPSTRQAYETTRKFAVGIIGSDVAMQALPTVRFGLRHPSIQCPMKASSSCCSSACIRRDRSSIFLG